MKKSQLILITLIFGLFGCQFKKNEVVISGKITGVISHEFGYSVPLDGISYAGFKEEIIPDSSGHFKVKFPIENPAIIHIIAYHQASGRLIVEPNKEYNVELNLESKKQKFKVTGENQNGQNEFNSLPSRNYRKFLNDTIVANIEQNIKSEMKNEITKFHELFKEGKISEDFFELVKIDRECYYAGIKGTIANFKSNMDYRFNIGLYTPEVENMWTRTFDETPVALSSISRSQWFFDLMKNYIRYNWYTNESFNRDILIDNYEKGLIHTYTISESKKYLPENLHELYQACYLWFESIQDSYDRELIQLFEQFKKDFPQSRYTKFLTPKINGIIEYHKKLEKRLKNKNITFIENSNNISSIKDCVDFFKGKMIYIDVWATWCGPCHDEFQYKEHLKKMLDSKDIVLFYISIDKEQDEKQWKDMINFYELEGYHIRANKNLDSDLRKLFGQDGKLAIPWYILVDKNGMIIKKHASRPSQLKSLKKEINMK